MLAGRSGLGSGSGLGALMAWGFVLGLVPWCGPGWPQGPAAWARGQGLGGLAHNWICGVRNQFEIRYRGGHLLACPCWVGIRGRTTRV